VVEVMFDSLFDAGVSTPSIYLSPARNARPHLVAKHVLRNLLLEILNKEWTFRTRSNKAHVSFKDIPELWPFIYVKFSKESPTPGYPWIISVRHHGARLELRVHIHGPELVHHKRFSIQSHPFLFEKDGPSGTKLDERNDDGQKDGCSKEAKEGKRHIHRPLKEGVHPAERNITQVDDGDAVEILDPGTNRHVFENVGNHLDVDDFVSCRMQDL